ncbi:MAG: hypothetical protein IPP13_14915 [Kouleothrix sp.]|nr:hypothetical protein [Kouleothrix sp.]
MSLYLSFQLLLILSATISIGLLGYALRYRYVPGALAFVLIIAGEGIWTIGYFAELRAELLIGKIVWDNIQFIGVDLAAIGTLVFALVYTHQDMLLRRFGALLGIEPIANILLVWTDPAHHLVRIAPQLDTAGAFPALVYSYGPWMWVMIAHAYLLMAVTLGLLVREKSRQPAAVSPPDPGDHAWPGRAADRLVHNRGRPGADRRDGVARSHADHLCNR